MAALLGLAMATWWYAELMSNWDNSVTKQSPHARDYYMKGLTKTVMDASGEPEQVLIADHLDHFGDDNTSELLNPELTLLDSKRPSWILQSNTGLVTPDAQEIFLGGEVNIDRAGGKQSPPIKITTKDLTVKFTQNYAQSENYTEIVSPEKRISAVGARIHFAYPVRVNLNSNVRGHYEIH